MDTITDNNTTSRTLGGHISILLHNRSYSLALLILLMTATMSLFYVDTFFTFYNFKTIFETLALEGILAVGMMLLIVSGVFDLSVGSSIAVAGAVCALFVGGHAESFQASLAAERLMSLPIPLGIVLGIGASALAGLFNGVMVAYIGMNPLISTLAMMGILRGISKLIASTRIPLPDAIIMLGQKTVLGIELPAYYLVIIVSIFAVLLAKLRFFRQLYYIGSNQKAAELSGINVKLILLLNFVLMGILAGFIGIVKAGKLTAAIATIGSGVELRVITAVIIGGGSLNGGKGTIFGAFMGALFMALVSNIMLLSGIPIAFHSMIIGIIMLLAVILDVKMQPKS